MSSLKETIKLDDKEIWTVANFYRDPSEDRKTGIVRLTIEWKNPYVAATWANQMAARLNQRMRQRALSEANANIAYLRSELAATNAVALQDTVGRLLEMELKKAMLAKGNREYSYRVIDPASAPRHLHQGWSWKRWGWARREPPGWRSLQELRK
jgi:hypothetical protein